MKNSFLILIAVLLVIVLLAFMFLFQVPYDEKAVVTTFDKATENSVKKEPGLYVRWPAPIQGVQKYSSLLQLLDGTTEETTLKDGASVVVKYVIHWRIDDPYAFFRTYHDVADSQKKLNELARPLVMEAMKHYSLSDLLSQSAASRPEPARNAAATEPAQTASDSPGKSKLDQVENEAWGSIKQAVDGQQGGVKIVQVSIVRLLWPEKTTTDVYDQMRKTRETLAADIRASGDADAAQTESNARRIRDTILAFARRRADEIRAEGLKEAAEQYKTFNTNAELAITLQQIETIKRMIGSNATLLINARDLGLDSLLGVPASPFPARKPAEPPPQSNK